MPIKYSLVATDIDGTLLNELHLVTPRTRAAIDALHEQGVQVIPCTGRAPLFVSRLYSDLGLKGPIICSNGAIVYNPPSLEFWLKRPMALNVVKKVLDVIRSTDGSLNVGIQTLEMWYVDRPDGWMQVEAEGNLVPGWLGVVDLAEKLVVDRPEILKMAFGISPAARAALEKNLGSSGLLGQIEMVSSGTNFVEINARGVSKGTGLEFLAARLGIPMSQVVALGDQENDISAIKAAGLGVAMGNALDSVKEAADLVTLSHVEEGWVKAIEQVVLT